MNYQMLSRLSKSEQEIVKLLITGKNNKQIADALFVSEKTIKFHLTNIYSKLGVNSRAECIVLVNEMNFDHLNKNQGEKVEEVEYLPKQGGIAPVTANNQLKRISQEEKVNFIHDKFAIGHTVSKLQHMMDEVTKKEINANNVNAACNCVARLNETIDVAIKAARFLSER